MIHESNFLAVDMENSYGRVDIGKFDGKRIKLQEVHKFRNERVIIQGHFLYLIILLFLFSGQFIRFGRL